MALLTKAEVAAKITALDEKIEKAEQGSYTTGLGIGLTRPRLKDLYEERRYWLKEYERLAAAEAAGGAFVNKAKFQRPA